MMNSMMSTMRNRRPMYSQSGGKPNYKSTPQPYANPQDNSWNDGGQLINRQADFGNQAQSQGQAANSSYLDRNLNFDAGKAINRYAQGAWNQTQVGFNKNLTALRGNQVAGGRLDTGFNDEDTGELYRSTVNDFSDNVAKTAVQGAQLDLDNNRGLADFGQNQQQQYADMMMSRREEVTNNDREQSQRKRQKKRGIAGAIGGALGGVGGFLASGGNPMGAYAGYKIGKGIAGGG